VPIQLSILSSKDNFFFLSSCYKKKRKKVYLHGIKGSFDDASPVQPKNISPQTTPVVFLQAEAAAFMRHIEKETSPPSPFSPPTTENIESNRLLYPSLYFSPFPSGLV
jgi:hypothetical protein